MIEVLKWKMWLKKIQTIHLNNIDKALPDLHGEEDYGEHQGDVEHRKKSNISEENGNLWGYPTLIWK